MKKILIALMIVSLVLVSLIGCSSSKEANTKTEEELRQEVSAELEAEAKARAELEEQIRAELETEQKSAEAATQQPAQQTQPAQPTQPVQQTQPASGNQQSPSPTDKIEIFPIYEMGQDYPINFYEHTHEPDFFKVVNTGDSVYMRTSGANFDFSNVDPEFVFYKYKIIEHVDEELYVFVLSQGNPPHGSYLKFFLYSTGYALEYLGSVSPYIELVDADIKELDHSRVKINGTFYELIN